MLEGEGGYAAQDKEPRMKRESQIRIERRRFVVFWGNGCICRDVSSAMEKFI